MSNYPFVLKIDQPALVYNTAYMVARYPSFEEAAAGLALEMECIKHPNGKFRAEITNEATGECLHEQEYEVEL